MANHETSSSLVYWFLGREKAGKLSDFLIQRSPFARACLNIHLRPVGQSAEADEAEFNYNSIPCRTACSSLDRKSYQTLDLLIASHHTSHCYKPRACAPVQADGCSLSIFQAAWEPSLCALSFTQDLHSTLQSALSLLLKIFYLSRPRVSKIQI